MPWRPAAGAAATIAVFAAAAGPAFGAGERILLPSVATVLTPGPPLSGNGTVPPEQLVPRGLASDERVLVGIDARGEPVSVVVVQRLTIRRPGDYTFAVAGPIVDVAAAAGSDSEPGLRRDLVLWAGFSPGRKTLAARVQLRPADAAAALPVRVRREAGRLVLENATGVDGAAYTGAVDARSAAAALDVTRRTLARGPEAPDVVVRVPRLPVQSRRAQIAASLRVVGSVGGVTFSRRLGGGYPNRVVLRVPSGRVHLVVTPVAPLRLLAPPGGSPTWVDALRLGRVDPSTLLERASGARLTLARTYGYRRFLANPEPHGRSSATYVYATRRASAPGAARPVADGDGGPWTTVLLAVAAVAGAAGLVVLWAHS